MGFENMYGVGKGAAQVFNSSGIVNAYANQLQQQGLQRQKDQDAYAKELAALNFDGVRQADVATAQKKWSLVKDKYHELSKTDNDSKKLQIRSEIYAIKNDMTAFKKRSIDQQGITNDITKTPLTQNKWQIAPDFGESLKTRESLSIDDPRFAEYGVEKFQAQAKPLDLNKEADDMAKFSAKQVNIEGTRGEGIDKKYTKTKGLQLDEPAFKTMILKRMANDGQFKDESLKGLEPTPENLSDVADSYWHIVKDKYKPDTTDGNYVDPSGRQLAISKELARYSNSLPSKAGSSNSALFRQDQIVRIMTNEPGSGEELVAAAKGKGIDLTIITSNKTGKPIGIKVPQDDAKEVAAYTVYFNDPDKKQAYIKLNSLISNITGENVNLSTVMTDKGKKQVVGGKDVKSLKNEPTKPSNNKVEDLRNKYKY